MIGGSFRLWAVEAERPVAGAWAQLISFIFYVFPVGRYGKLCRIN